MKVLLTGAAGSIGRVLGPGLGDLGHEVVTVDLPGRPADLAADLTNAHAALRVVGETRPDAVVHLAGRSGEGSLAESLASHAMGTAALLEAMLAQGVRRIVYASSNHAVGRIARSDSHLPAQVPRRPDTFYGVAKVTAEMLLQLYVDRHGIDAVATRIGSFGAAPTSRRQLATWLSHADAIRMFEAALTTPAPGFAVMYGISANTRGWWDLEAGRALGYEPQDDAEVFAADIEAAPPTPDDEAEAMFVGGPFATPRFERPAF